MVETAAREATVKWEKMASPDAVSVDVAIASVVSEPESKEEQKMPLKASLDIFALGESFALPLRHMVCVISDWLKLASNRQ